jgi:hypothetical protein
MSCMVVNLFDVCMYRRMSILRSRATECPSAAEKRTADDLVPPSHHLHVNLCLRPHRRCVWSRLAAPASLSDLASPPRASHGLAPPDPVEGEGRGGARHHGSRAEEVVRPNATPLEEAFHSCLRPRPTSTPVSGHCRWRKDRGRGRQGDERGNAGRRGRHPRSSTGMPCRG